MGRLPSIHIGELQLDFRIAIVRAIGYSCDKLKAANYEIPSEQQIHLS